MYVYVGGCASTCTCHVSVNVYTLATVLLIKSVLECPHMSSLPPLLPSPLPPSPLRSPSLPSLHLLYLPLPTSLSLIRNGMLREAQLSTRNMVNAVTEEFWKMVRGSISDQALHFKSTLYMLVVIIIILNFHFQCINHPIKKY